MEWVLCTVCNVKISDLFLHTLEQTSGRGFGFVKPKNSASHKWPMLGFPRQPESPAGNRSGKSPTNAFGTRQTHAPPIKLLADHLFLARQSLLCLICLMCGRELRCKSFCIFANNPNLCSEFAFWLKTPVWEQTNLKPPAWKTWWMCAIGLAVVFVISHSSYLSLLYFAESVSV